MSDAQFQVPKLCRRKATNRAHVKWNGGRKYLVKWESAEAQEAYEKIVNEHRRMHDDSGKWTTLIKRLAVAFLKHADAYYRRPDECVKEKAIGLIQKFLTGCSFGLIRSGQRLNDRTIAIDGRHCDDDIERLQFHYFVTSANLLDMSTEKLKE